MIRTEQYIAPISKLSIPETSNKIPICSVVFIEGYTTLFFISIKTVFTIINLLYLGNIFPEENEDIGYMKMHSLRLYVCDCLHSIMRHDSTGFITKQQFELIMQPLVDQVTKFYRTIMILLLFLVKCSTGCIVSFYYYYSFNVEL